MSCIRYEIVLKEVIFVKILRKILFMVAFVTLILELCAMLNKVPVGIAVISACICGVLAIMYGTKSK